MLGLRQRLLSSIVEKSLATAYTLESCNPARLCSGCDKVVTRASPTQPYTALRGRHLACHEIVIMAKEDSE